MWCSGTVSHSNQWHTGAATSREAVDDVQGLLESMSGDGRGEAWLSQRAATGLANMCSQHRNCSVLNLLGGSFLTKKLSIMHFVSE